MTRSRRWLTGDTPTEGDELCRGISVPNEIALVSAVTGALLPLTQPDNWEKYGELTPEETAEIMSAAFEGFVTSTCGGDCPPVTLPDGIRIYRKSPETGRIEYLDDTGTEDWLEPTGDDALPEPTAREETEEIDRLCAASTNAVECLRVTLEDVLDAWNSVSGPAEALTTMVTSIVGWAGATFYPPMYGFAKLAEVAFIAFYELMDAITWNFWDADFTDRLVCIFKTHATDTDGVVTFDLDAIVADLWGEAWWRGEYLLLVTQVQYLLSVVGEQALNIAGTTTTLEGDCNGCGSWFMEATPQALGFELQLNSYYTTEGYLADGPWQGFRAAEAWLTLDTSNCEITRVAFFASYPGGATGFHFIDVYPSNGPLYYERYFNTYAQGGWETSQDNEAFYSTTAETVIRIVTGYDGTTDRSYRTTLVRVWGTGLNPFSA